MPLPTIEFHSSGSDTASSGYGGVNPNGTGASFTASSATVDVSADSPDLSLVIAGDLFWGDTSSGRQFSVISSVDDGSDTVTCEDTFANTESSKNWGIGGQRQTLDDANSRKLLSADAKAGWTIELQSDQAITTSALTIAVGGDAGDGVVLIKGDSTSSHRVMTQAANAPVFLVNSANADFVKVENLKFANSNETKTSAYGIQFTAAAQKWCLLNCIFGDVTNDLQIGVYRSGGQTPNMKIIDCEIADCNSYGIQLAGSPSALEILHCAIHDNGAAGVYIDAGYGWVIEGCAIWDNTGAGILFSGTPAGGYGFGLTVRDSTIHSNGSDGIDMSGSAALARSAMIHNNNITANGGYGIDSYSGAEGLLVMVDYNNFGTGATANTSGAMNNITAGANDLAVDPTYANAGGEDFSVGTNVKAEGFPDAARNIGADQSSTVTYLDLGAAQREEAAGGATEVLWKLQPAA